MRQKCTAKIVLGTKYTFTKCCDYHLPKKDVACQISTGPLLNLEIHSCFCRFLHFSGFFLPSRHLTVTHVYLLGNPLISLSRLCQPTSSSRTRTIPDTSKHSLNICWIKSFNPTSKSFTLGRRDNKKFSSLDKHLYFDVLQFKFLE